MVSRATASFNITADIRGAIDGLRRIDNYARDVSTRVNRLSGGSLGLGVRAAGAGVRAGRAAGGIVGAGFGLQAGFAVFEQVVEQIAELFEGTPIMEEFIQTIKDLFIAIAPLIGVLLEVLTPIIKALTPVITELALAFTPLLRILGGNLLVIIQLLTPLITVMANVLEFLLRKFEQFIGDIINAVVKQLNRIPFITVDTSGFPDQGGIDRARAQLTDAAVARARAEAGLPADESDNTGDRPNNNQNGGTRAVSLEDQMRQMGESARARPAQSLSEREMCLRNELTIDGEVLARRTVKTNQLRREEGA